MPDQSRICRRLVVSGQVQGVFFRDSTRRRATRAGVAGWVANRADGTVEALFEGDPAAVERMIEYCRQGPGHAQVDDVAVSECAPEGRTAFDVR